VEALPHETKRTEKSLSLSFSICHGNATILEVKGHVATIKDVAQKASVGVGTVSRVLNGKGYVSEDARQKVMEAIVELQYVPNAQARAMMTKRSMTIGVTLPDLTNPYFPSLLRGIEDEARRSSYTVIMIETDWKPTNESQAVDILRRQSVDGIILIDTELVELLTRTLMQAEVPIVLCNRGVERSDVEQVLVNNYQGAADAMAWIRQRGHRRVGFLAGPENANSARQRLRAYLDCMDWHSIPVDEINRHPELPLERANFLFEDAKQATERLLQRHPDLTCLFAANDLSALGALSYLSAQGMRVPDQIALVGFDDLLMASLVHPPLTTVRQPVYEMGTASARLLIERINNPEGEVKRLIFDPVLVTRQSC
jgi:DNA-binding LacI/PurR family transcriptional regulator